MRESIGGASGEKKNKKCDNSYPEGKIHVYGDSSLNTSSLTHNIKQEPITIKRKRPQQGEWVPRPNQHPSHWAPLPTLNALISFIIVTATLSPTASHCVPHPPSPARHPLPATHFFIYLFLVSFPCAASHTPSYALSHRILPRKLPNRFRLG